MSIWRIQTFIIVLSTVCGGAWRLKPAAVRHPTHPHHHPALALSSATGPLAAVKPRRRTGIPYVESFPEQRVRELWESDPFQVSRAVVQAVVQRSSFHQHDSSSSSMMEPHHHQPPLLELHHDEQFITGTHHPVFDKLYTNHRLLTNWTIPSKKLPVKDKKRHFLLEVAYRGDAFCGWQRQSQHSKKPSVQQVLEDRLSVLEGTCVNVRVCGRTDAGVHALGQVCRFRCTHTSSVEQIQDCLAPKDNSDDDASPWNNLKLLQAVPVTRSFHPSFGAKWRAYVYLVDVGDTASSNGVPFDVAIMDANLQTLRGQTLNYIGLSYGKLKTQDAMCALHHARARFVSTTIDGRRHDAIAVELVGDRFLRRMVRRLVEATLRIACRQEEDVAASPDTLLQWIQQQDRNLIGMAAPPDGLHFVGAEFSEL